MSVNIIAVKISFALHCIHLIGTLLYLILLMYKFEHNDNIQCKRSSLLIFYLTMVFLWNHQSVDVLIN